MFNRSWYYYACIVQKEHCIHFTFQNIVCLGTKVYGVAKMFSLVVTHVMLLEEMENTKVLFWLTLFTNHIGILLKSGDMNLISFLCHRALGFVGAGFACATSWQLQILMVCDWLGSESARTKVWSQKCQYVFYFGHITLMLCVFLDYIFWLEGGFVQSPLDHSMLVLIDICPYAMICSFTFHFP